MMSAVRLQPCHLREDSSVRERTLKAFWGGFGLGSSRGGLGQYFSFGFNSTRRTRSSLKCFIFYFTSLHCISSIPFHFTGKGPRSARVLRPRAKPSRAERVTSRWSQKPVGPQSELPPNDSSSTAAAATLSCC